jgi:hypothetical protein
MMIEELTLLFQATPDHSSRDACFAAVIEDNVLNKPTVATRRLTVQRLSELYALDENVTLFRVLRRFWRNESQGRPLLAVLCALARDPLLRLTTDPVLALRAGEELSRQRLTDVLRPSTEGRFNDATLDQIIRNTSASWTQSGHLQGRNRKIRQAVRPTPIATAYALLLGYLQGLRGNRLFETPWTCVLDATKPELLQQTADAKRLGVLDMKQAGDVIEVSFPIVLTPQEIKDSRVPS